MYTVWPDPADAAAEARLYADCRFAGLMPVGVAAGVTSSAAADFCATAVLMRTWHCMVFALVGVAHACLNFAELAALLAVLAVALLAVAVAACCGGAATAAVAPVATM